MKADAIKQIVKCPDCNMGMTQHTLKYIHKRRGVCKAIQAEPEKYQNQNKRTTITEDIANYYIKQNTDIISNYMRNERAMKAQRKQFMLGVH